MEDGKGSGASVLEERRSATKRPSFAVWGITEKEPGTQELDA
jgi:hypothetical protein